MEYVRYLARFLYRIRWYLILGTTAIFVLFYLLTKNMKGAYNVQATLYTGVVSGYSLENNAGRTDWAATQNAIDNLINIIKAENTLNRVSLRLFARVLINGNPDKENNYITPQSYNYTYNHVNNSPNGKQILSLIDKDSEDKTFQNLLTYQKPDKDNYIYGLFYYTHPYYSYNALKNINVNKKGSSDLLEVSYSSGDAGIVYHTLSILMEEFVNEYRSIRYGETDKVIEYFKGELARIGKELRVSEDSLTQYNVEKRIINYGDETKEIASINKEFELREQNILFVYNSSKAMIEELEKRMTSNEREAIRSAQLINKLREASNLTGKITEMETLPDEKKEGKKAGQSIQSYKDRLTQTRKELTGISDNYVASQFSQNGIARLSIVEQWLDQTLLFEKAKAELQIIQQSRLDLTDKYAFFAPVGSTIKRQERNISFIEQNYLSLLKSYNDALLRRKNLEMTSATLKVLNPPAYPIGAEPTNRKKIVMAATVGSFLFILGFLFLIEILDRTLRDPIRATRLIGYKVLGTYPISSLKYRSYSQSDNSAATTYMSTAILRFFTNRKEGQPYIINLLSTNEQVGKTFIGEQLENYWKSKGLQVRRLSWDKDFDVESRTFSLAHSVNELYISRGEDILIVEYPDLHKANISALLLKEAQINLLVASANEGWKDTDRMLAQKLKAQVGDTPLYICLNQVSRNILESYVGMLPPYTFIRQLSYRFSQLAFTEKFRLKRRREPQIDDHSDDD